MRAVIQRVTSAGVTVANEQIAIIATGLLILLGIENGDSQASADYLAEKIARLRIFEDNNQKMNLSVLDCNYEVLVVSQFTLLADCHKGRRPGFSAAATPEIAEPLCDYFISQLEQHKIVVKTGKFRTDMAVHLVNDGPVTIILDTNKKF